MHELGLKVVEKQIFGRKFIIIDTLALKQLQ